MKRSILIVEDDIIIATSTKMYIDELPSYQVNGIAHSIIDARQQIKINKPDLALLDINLGKGATGFDFALDLNQKNIPFIYVTSFADPETIAKALHTKPVSYLVKPFKKQALYAQLELAFSKINSSESILVKDGNKVLRINPLDICYIESDRNYIIIHSKLERFVIRMSLKSLLVDMPYYFVRIHKSHVVNINHVKEVKQEVRLINNMVLPLSRTYKSDLLGLLT